MANTMSPMKPQESKSDKGADFTDKARDMASNVADKARDTAANVADKARETAGNVADKAREAAGSVVDMAKGTASDLGKTAENATHAVGSGMKSLAGTLRDNLPKEGVIGAASSTVASGLESSGKYLEKEGLQGIAEDMTNLIRRNPIPALLLGIGLGFVLARATSTRSETMATDLKPAPDASVTDLVAGIVSDVQDLMKQQFELLKVEVVDGVRKTRDAGVLVGLGAGLALVGGILLTLMLVYLLSWAIPALPLWASFGIWGAIAGLAGGALIYAGKQKFASFNPLPDKQRKPSRRMSNG